MMHSLLPLRGGWCADKSTTSYAMLDFDSDIEKFLREISGN